MAIRSDWVVADTTARDALVVRDGDVAFGSESRLLSDGSVWRAVRSGSGEDCWTPVTLAAISDDVQADIPMESGTWTPTCTAVTNLDAVTGVTSQYFRFGNIVFIAGGATIDPTAASAWQFRMSLPVASDFSGTGQAQGVASGSSQTLGRMAADATNNQIDVLGTASGTSSTGVTFVGAYRVI